MTGTDFQPTVAIVDSAVTDRDIALRDVILDELMETGVRLLVFASVAPHDYWGVRSDLQERIRARFDAEGIRFAVPPRDVRLTGAAVPSTSDTSSD